MKRSKVPSASRSKRPESMAGERRTPNATDIHVGKAIRAHRLLLRMSQSELGSRLGVSFQQIQKYEKGTNRVGAGRLPQIAEILKIPIGTLFTSSAEFALDKGEQIAAPVNLITDATVLKLLTSFADITDRVTRSCLASLVEQMAVEARRNSQR